MIYTKKIIIALSVILLFGCKNVKQVDYDPEYRFNSLKVEQLNNKGVKQFYFETNKAQIIENSKTINAIDPSLLIYQESLPYVRVSSEKASLIKDGEKIILNNNVSLSTVDDNYLNILSQSFELDKLQSKAFIKGGLKAIIYGSNFNSKSAIYDFDNNSITFNNLIKYQYLDPYNRFKIQVDASNAIYTSNNSTLLFYNPNRQVYSKLLLFDN